MTGKVCDAIACALRREASGGDGALISDPALLRSAVADIAAAAKEGASGNKQALELREGLSLPRQTSLADARAAPQSNIALQRMQVRTLELGHIPCQSFSSAALYI